MSIDQHDPARQPSPQEGPDRAEKPKASLSVPQVLGGALAAMTAAALGSRLSLAGTVLGAAFASIIAAVAGALYTASLRRTTQGVSAVLTRVRPTSSTTTTTTTTTGGTTPVPPTDAGSTATDWVLPTELAEQSPDAAPVDQPRRRITWKPVLVGALLMFLVAALVLTGIELATGRALSGGSGTTVGQVADPGTRPAPTAVSTTSATPTPSSTPSASASPSATPSTAPSTAPSATPSSGPTATPSATPSTEATPSPTPTPSSTPSAAGGPSGLSPTS